MTVLLVGRYDSTILPSLTKEGQHSKNAGPLSFASFTYENDDLGNLFDIEFSIKM
jgi:hypothetical protein